MCSGAFSWKSLDGDCWIRCNTPGKIHQNPLLRSRIMGIDGYRHFFFVWRTADSKKKTQLSGKPLRPENQHFNLSDRDPITFSEGTWTLQTYITVSPSSPFEKVRLDRFWQTPLTEEPHSTFKRSDLLGSSGAISQFLRPRHDSSRLVTALVTDLVTDLLPTSGTLQPGLGPAAVASAHARRCVASRCGRPTHKELEPPSHGAGPATRNHLSFEFGAFQEG